MRSLVETPARMMRTSGWGTPICTIYSKMSWAGEFRIVATPLRLNDVVGQVPRPNSMAVNMIFWAAAPTSIQVVESASILTPSVLAALRSVQMMMSALGWANIPGEKVRIASMVCGSSITINLWMRRLPALGAQRAACKSRSRSARATALS